jgi:hypothetical protein
VACGEGYATDPALSSANLGVRASERRNDTKLKSKAGVKISGTCFLIPPCPSLQRYCWSECCERLYKRLATALHCTPTSNLLNATMGQRGGVVAGNLHRQTSQSKQNTASHGIKTRNRLISNPYFFLCLKTDFSTEAYNRFDIGALA